MSVIRTNEETQAHCENCDCDVAAVVCFMGSWVCCWCLQTALSQLDKVG
jgi:hypothetical protein